jgi:O-antigen/teichoic acid export membrane protein
MHQIESSKKTESRKVATIWNFFFLNIGFLVSLINGLLIIPIYLHYIDSSVYGAWLATGNILTWITIVDPGVSGVLLQRVAFALGKGDKEELGLAISSGILISSILFFIAVSLGYIFSFFITGLAKIDRHYSAEIVGAFRIALWGTALSLLADTFRNIVLAFQKTKIHGVFLNSVLFASIGVNVILLMCGFGVYALAYTSLFRGFATLACAVFFSISLIRKNKLKLKLNKMYFKSFSKVFTFTFSSSLFETIASNMDLILVSRFIGSSAVTVLDLSRRPLKIVISNVNSVSQAALPSLPHLFGSGDTAKIRNTVVRIWMVVLWLSSFVICGFLLFNYSFISNWVGKKFWIGNTYNVIICLSIFLLTIGYNLSNITTSRGEMKSNSIVNVVRSSIYIVLLLLLGKLFGMIGILTAYLLSVSIMAGYYPLKIVKTLLEKPDVKIIIQEIMIIVAIIITCIIASYSFKIQLSWVKFATGGVIYSIAFFTLLAVFSKRFKMEFGLIGQAIKDKIKANRK